MAARRQKIWITRAQPGADVTAERVRALGGSVKIWSTPGEGTSIVITLPVVEVVTENEEWHHGDA